MEYFLKIKNRHFANCGNPPEINRENVFFLSYFENVYGEQFVIYQNENGVHIRGGDLGWENDYQSIAGLVLDEEEMMWVRACLSIIHTREKTK